MLTLYRGDADKIKEFEFKKTNKYCLLGQGIYLTDSLSIANTYRTKGSGQMASHQLFYGEAEHRLEAFDKGFPTFCERAWASEHGPYPWYRNVPEKDRKKHEEKCRAHYKELIERKEITAEYVSPPISTLKQSSFIKPSSAIAWRKEQEKKHKRYLKVVWEEIPNAGYVTRFEFREEQFNPTVFNVDKACNDEFFWTLMYEGKLMIGHPADSLEDYIRLNNGRKVFDAVNQPTTPQGRVTMQTRLARYDTKATWRKIGNIIKPYGFVGYEYSGGLRLGGKIHHRAFCIWDETFVNDHKVERFK